MILEVSKKVDDVDFRIERISKNQEGLEVKVTSVEPYNKNNGANYSNSNSDYELRLLKEAFNNEK